MRELPVNQVSLSLGHLVTFPPWAIQDDVSRSNITMKTVAVCITHCYYKAVHVEQCKLPLKYSMHTFECVIRRTKKFCSAIQSQQGVSSYIDDHPVVFALH